MSATVVRFRVSRGRSGEGMAKVSAEIQQETDEREGRAPCCSQSKAQRLASLLGLTCSANCVQEKTEIMQGQSR